MRAIEQRVGAVWPPTPPYPITETKVREFAIAVGHDVPVGGVPAVPPTFAAVLAMSAWDALYSDPELDLRLDRTVHVDQRFTWQRPLRIGDEVTATLSVEKARVRGASAFITLNVSLATLDGEPLVEAESTLLHAWPREDVS